jgi:hypothetical protein
MIGLKIKGLAAGTGDVAQRQQHFGRGQVLAGAPIQPCAVGTACDKLLDQRRLSGSGLRGNGDDASFARARMRKGLA